MQDGFYLRQAHEKGIPIIAIDPRYTLSAETLADKWIPIRKATDSAFLLAVANVLFKEDLYNHDFVQKFIEPTGFQKWRDYVVGNSAGPDGAIDRTPEWASPICGVPVETIKAFAELYAASSPCFWACGTHIGNKQPGGHNTIRIIMTLQAMTGNWGVEGGTDGNTSGPRHPWNGSWRCTILAHTGSHPRHRADAWTIHGTPVPHGQGLFMHWRWPDVILLREQYDQGNITLEQYINAIGANLNNPPPNIHMTFTGESFLVNGPGNNKHMKALPKLDYIVAVSNHCRTQTPSAQTSYCLAQSL